MRDIWQVLIRKFKSFSTLAIDSFKAWQRDNVARLAAALAYYALLSAAPLLAFTIYLVGQLIGRGEALSQLSMQARMLFGPQVADFFEGIVGNAIDVGTTPLGAALTLGGFLLGGSGLFLQFQGILNTIWGVNHDPKAGWGLTIIKRVLALGMVLGISVVFFAIILINASFSVIGEQIQHFLPFPNIIMQIIQYTVIFVLVILLMAFIYKFIPDVKIAWRDVWVGSIVTAVLFVIGQLVLGIYLGRTSFDNVYGAAGTLVVLLVWLYYTSQIIFLGAEFTQVYANQHGSYIRPSDDAIWVDKSPEMPKLADEGHAGLDASEIHE